LQSDPKSAGDEPALFSQAWSNPIAGRSVSPEVTGGHWNANR
jgi:hypothetical protein